MSRIQMPIIGARVCRPLPTVEAWADRLAALDIPVLASTAGSLERLRAEEDDIDAHSIAEAMSSDPLMTLKILVHAGSHQGKRVVTDAETVTEALVMMGISPFFRAFGPQPTVEEWLADEPTALAALQDTVRRTHRGANLALAFAVHRMDPDAGTVHAGALLHEFAESLLWCHAPGMQLRIAAMQKEDATLRTKAAQEQILNIDVRELQIALSRRWHLPSLLAQPGSGRHLDDTKVRTIDLAARLARHLPRGWDSEAVGADIVEIAELLNLSVSAAEQLIRDVWPELDDD
jgi:HD-like signal output (HDOD) protein